MVYREAMNKTIFKNTFYLTLAEVITRFLNLAIFIYAARILGDAEYGKFVFALSFTSIAVIFTDLGLFDITVREFSRKREEEKQYPAILSLKIILSIGVFVLIFISSFFISSDPIVQRIIWLLGIFLLISGFLNILFAFLRARQKMQYEAVAKIFQIVLIAILSFVILFVAPSAENLSYVYLIANLIVLILALVLFHYLIQFIRLSFNKAIWKKFLKLSWPLSLGFVMGWIYVSIDSVMIGYFGQIAQVGWYNAAYKIIAVTVISATIISKSLYPVLSKFFVESKEKLQKIWDYQMESIIILAVPIVMGGFVLASKIINFFYGPDYSPSIIAFQFLVFVCAIDFLYFPYAVALVISNQQKKNFGLLLIGAVINIILNLILIPFYGFCGAATATIISSFIILVLAVLLSKYYTPISPFNFNIFKVLTAAVFSGIAMLIVIKQPLIYSLNIFLTVIIGGLIYSFLLFLFYILLRGMHQKKPF